MKVIKKQIELSLQSYMYYKSSFFLNILSPLLLIIGQFALWTALFSNGTDIIGGYTQREMFTYVLVSFAIQQSLTWSSENIISRNIRTGDIVSRIIRPVPLIIQNISEMIGKAIPQVIFNFSFLFIVLLLFNNYLFIPGLINIILFLLSFVLGIILRMVFVNCFSLISFYTTSHLGVTWTRNAISEFFSGAIVPVTLFPKWLFRIAKFTPFPLMLQVPVSIFLNETSYISFQWTFLLQVFWIIVFLIIHEIIYYPISKNLIIAGG